MNVHINEVSINQDAAGFNAQDAIGLGEKVRAVVIRNAFNSTQNLMIGWNQQANAGNTIPPGSSVPYEIVGTTLDGNNLYIGFEGSSGGKALVTIYSESGEDCPPQ